MMPFTFRTARPEDIPALVALEEDVEKSLPSRDMFATDGPEFYEPIVAGAGHILLAFDASGRLAGVNVLRYPAPDDSENLGLDLGLSLEELGRVRHMESVFLRGDCRGCGLAFQLMQESIRLCEKDGRNISLATVWPRNAASLQLFFRLGFHIRAFAYKYGGRPRFILMRSPTPLRFGEPATLAEADDHAAHQRLLASGMAGTGFQRGEGGRILIEYRPLLKGE